MDFKLFLTVLVVIASMIGLAMAGPKAQNEGKEFNRKKVK